MLVYVIWSKTKWNTPFTCNNVRTDRRKHKCLCEWGGRKNQPKLLNSFTEPWFVLLAVVVFFFFFLHWGTMVCVRERMNVVILMFMNCLLACAIFLFDGGIVTDCVRTDSCMSIISVTLLLFLFLLMENKLDWSSLHKSLSASRALFSTSRFQISVWHMNFRYFYVHVSTAVYSGHRGFKKRCSIMELGGGKTTWIFGDCKDTFIFSPNMPLYCNFHVCRFIFFPHDFSR